MGSRTNPRQEAPHVTDGGGRRDSGTLDRRHLRLLGLTDREGAKEAKSGEMVLVNRILSTVQQKYCLDVQM